LQQAYADLSFSAQLNSCLSTEMASAGSSAGTVYQMMSASQAFRAPTDRQFVHRDVGELSAKAELRRQIGELDATLCALRAEAHPTPLGIASIGGGPARLLSLADLESLRDQLASAVEDARSALTDLRASQQEARGLVERMLADPGSYRWLRVSREEAGLVGCGHWHVVPRFGPIGLLTGWWRVKISSGCP